VLLEHFEESPAGETSVELALALGIPLSDVEARLDQMERNSSAVAGRGLDSTNAAASACPAAHLQAGLRFLVGSLRSQRAEPRD
jgi:hypothetical protein